MIESYDRIKMISSGTISEDFNSNGYWLFHCMVDSRAANPQALTVLLRRPIDVTVILIVRLADNADGRFCRNERLAQG